MNPDDRIARALGGLDRLPPTTRRALMAVIPVLLFATLVATFALAPSERGGDAPARRPAAPGHWPAYAPVLPAPRSAPAAVARERARSAAKDAALRFLRGYLAYSYGRGVLDAVGAADPRLIGALRGARPRVPPAARERHPRVTSLQVLAQAPGTAQATATIADGSGSGYPLVFYLDRRASGWTVTRLADD